MPAYELNMSFTNEQLQTLYLTGSNVIVAKPTGGLAPNVAWQVIRPLQANSLTWEEQYGVYASTAKVTNAIMISGCRPDSTANCSPIDLDIPVSTKA